MRRGRRAANELLWVSFAADAELERPRVAFALNRSSGSAVERNRARRRLRAILAQNANRLATGRYLIGVRRPAAQVTYRRAQTELLDLLKSARAISPPLNTAK